MIRYLFFSPGQFPLPSKIFPKPPSFLTLLAGKLVVFLVLLTVCTPVYNSYDDIYLMNLLSGATGDAPTSLLHYPFIIHPVFGVPLAFLFKKFESINWFSLLLYTGQLLGWTQIAHVILKRAGSFYGLLLYGIVFLTFGAPVLLQPTFSDVSYLLTITAAITICAGIDRTLTRWELFVAGTYLIMASLFRVHTMIPMLALLAIVFFFFQRKPRCILLFLLTTVVITAFVLGQITYYKENIPGWQQEERYRSLVLSIDNHYKQFDTTGADPQLVLKADFLQYGILIDKSFLDSASVNKIRLRKTGARAFDELKTEAKWLIVNNRIGLCVYGFLLLLFVLVRPKLPNRRITSIIVIYQVLTLLLLHLYLLVFMKTPSTLLGSTTLLACVFLLHFLTPALFSTAKTNVVMLAGITLFFAWAIIRIQKIDEKNSTHTTIFLAARDEVIRQRDKLFIAPYFGFPYRGIGVFDSPRQFYIPNVVTKNELLNNTHLNRYRRFHISSPADLFRNPAIRFLVAKPELIKEYLAITKTACGNFKPAPEQYTVLRVTSFAPCP